MKRYRAVARRLTRLAAQQPPPAPDEAAIVDALTIDEVLSEAGWGMRDTALAVDGFAALRCLITNVDRGARYWQRVAERANVLCAQHNWWLCPLARAEAIEAIAAVESGLLRVRSPAHEHRGPLPIWDFSLLPPWQHIRWNALWALGSAVHRAFWCYAQQTGALADRDIPMDAATLLAWLENMRAETAEGEAIEP
jgi:hypothetical protein